MQHRIAEYILPEFSYLSFVNKRCALKEDKLSDIHYDNFIFDRKPNNYEHAQDQLKLRTILIWFDTSQWLQSKSRPFMARSIFFMSRKEPRYETVPYLCIAIGCDPTADVRQAYMYVYDGDSNTHYSDVTRMPWRIK